MTYEKYVQFRDKRKLTDAEVARAAGLSYGTMSGWKRGEYTPKIDKQLRIAEVVGIPAAVVIAEFGLTKNVEGRRVFDG